MIGRSLHPCARRLRARAGALLPVVWFSLLCALALACPAARAGSTAPTVAITSPTAGSTVMGTVTVDVTATATGASDYPTDIRLLDGVNEIADEPCASGQPTCTVSASWHATGDTGQHTLTATAQTNEGASATSAPVQVTVLSPPPTVTIASPGAGATVKGNVTVAVSGATNPSQDDYPTGIAVYDGVNEIGAIRCQGQQTCEGSVTWRATGLTGQHVLTAQIKTNRGLDVTSPAVDVTVESPPPTVAIVSPSNGYPLGGEITIVVSGATDPSQVDYPTSIQVNDGSEEIGHVSCQGQPTCGGSLKWSTKGLTGVHVLTAVIHTNTGRSTASAPVMVGGSHPRARRYSRPSCRLTKYAVAVRRVDHGVCTVGGVPAGTAIEIQAKGQTGGWVTVVRGRLGRGAVFYFRLKAARRSTFRLAVVVGATRAYLATRVAFATLRVG